MYLWGGGSGGISESCYIKESEPWELCLMACFILYCSKEFLKNQLTKSTREVFLPLLLQLLSLSNFTNLLFSEIRLEMLWCREDLFVKIAWYCGCHRGKIPVSKQMWCSSAKECIERCTALAFLLVDSASLEDDIWNMNFNELYLSY